MSNPLCQNVAQRKVHYDIPDSQCRGAKAARREGRIARAGWWFAQMRDIVERAMEATGEPRPEQIWIPGANREVGV
jgi:hypothetical protein